MSFSTLSMLHVYHPLSPGGEKATHALNGYIPCLFTNISASNHKLFKLDEKLDETPNKMIFLIVKKYKILSFHSFGTSAKVIKVSVEMFYPI